MLIAVGALPQAPLAAAAAFHAQVLPRIALAHAQMPEPADTPEPLVLVFDPADHTHRAWRLAAVQELAREQAPRRVNAVASDDARAIAAAARYLDAAPGVTGQYLALDGTGATDALS